MMPNTQDVATKPVPNVILQGPLLPEPIKVITTTSLGTSYKITSQGLKPNQIHQPILTFEQIALLMATPEKDLFGGDARRFRLGIKALHLGLAYAYYLHTLNFVKDRLRGCLIQVVVAQIQLLR